MPPVATGLVIMLQKQLQAVAEHLMAPATHGSHRLHLFEKDPSLRPSFLAAA
jgi:hypothetical protein